MKYTVTVENAPRNSEDFHNDFYAKREYRKAQKSMRDLRRGKKNRWNEVDRDGR